MDSGITRAFGNMVIPIRYLTAITSLRLSTDLHGSSASRWPVQQLSQSKRLSNLKIFWKTFATKELTLV